jgi:NAD(P)-dependent dehydrogenase (short-subunit alcohol dehydrogenase family)
MTAGRVASGRMQGRVTIVTGASSGIGRAAALRLAQEGARLALVALPGAALDAAAEECARAGGEAVAIAADLGRPEEVTAAFDRAARAGPISAVFNNAGMSRVVPITAMTDELWEHQLRTNLSSSFYVAREAARHMMPRRYGVIVNTASELAVLGQAGYAGYTATKGGILAMSRALAAELAGFGIRVNAVCPGAVDTPLLAAEFAQAADPAGERLATERSIALGRIGQPEEIAQAVLFLLSDEASYITGAQLLVDGGRTGCFPSGALPGGTTP